MAGKTDVGTETLSYCTSCKMDLAHIIVSMKGDKIAKVECKTCKKTHVFKAPKGITEPGQVKKKPSKKQQAEIKTVEAEWERLMTTHKDAPMKNYTMKTPFNLGDKVSHKTFGDGIVGRLIYPNKIEVVFRSDVKILIHQGVKQS